MSLKRSQLKRKSTNITLVLKKEDAKMLHHILCNLTHFSRKDVIDSADNIIQCIDDVEDIV